MNTNLQIIERAFPIGSIDAYGYWVNQIPMLSKEEEQALASKLKHEGDLEAARRLILSHLRFVVHIAKGYLSYGLQQADLIQEGNIGLMKAVKHFDPDRGVRLVSFAVHWIKAEIHEFVLRNWRIVKMATTKAQRKLFFNLRKMAHKMGRLGWFTKDEIHAVAKELKVKPEEVMSMEMRLNNSDVAFDGIYDEDDDSDGERGNWSAPCNYLSIQDQSASADPAEYLENEDWTAAREQHLNKALQCLDLRSRDIIAQRWLAGKKATLHKLAAKYNVSAERVRQLEQMAMLKLKQEITAQS